MGQNESKWIKVESFWPILTSEIDLKKAQRAQKMPKILPKNRLELGSGTPSITVKPLTETSIVEFSIFVAPNNVTSNYAGSVPDSTSTVKTSEKIDPILTRFDSNLIPF